MLKQQRFGKEFEALFTENYTRLYHLAYQYLNDAETSKDIVSDAFEYLWRNYETFREKNPLVILHQTVRTKSIDYYRHSRVESNYAEILPPLPGGKQLRGDVCPHGPPGDK